MVEINNKPYHSGVIMVGLKACKNGPRTIETPLAEPKPTFPPSPRELRPPNPSQARDHTGGVSMMASSASTSGGGARPWHTAVLTLRDESYSPSPLLELLFRRVRAPLPCIALASPRSAVMRCGS